MDKYFSTHTFEKKRELGAYYTPRTLSQIMADWAIRSDQDRVLEPSFGGCGFLEACVETLTKLGSSSPVKQLYGADIDLEAFNFLFEKLGSLTDLNSKNFICRDFLETSTESYGSRKFDVVVGNPPYVSMHKMTMQQKKNCFHILKNSKFSPDSIGRNPSLWAFFLVHSLSFITQNGRVAWVLPSSFIHADYSKKVIDSYCRYFSQVTIFKLYERFFLDDGATEVSVIMLASGFDSKKLNSCEAMYSEVDNLSQLREKILNENLSTDFLVFRNGYKVDSLSNTVGDFYRHIQKQSYVKRLGDLAEIKIGMVTGDNKTFVINQKQSKNSHLHDNDLMPVISRFSQLSGLNLTESRYKKLLDNDQRVLLVCPENINKKFTPIRNYLSSVTSHSRRTNKTFPKRQKWFHPDDRVRPDAFLSCMMHEDFRLVINSAELNCTNSLHRVTFIQNVSSKYKKAVAVSTMSSLTQLSGEIEGRSYGSGVLKLEPSPAKKLLIILNEPLIEALSNIYQTVDKLVSNHKNGEARKLIDSTIANTLSIPIERFYELNHAILKLRSDRYKGLKKGVENER